MELVAALQRLGYKQTRPARAIPPGTLAALIKDAAAQMDTTVEDILGKIR